MVYASIIDHFLGINERVVDSRGCSPHQICVQLWLIDSGVTAWAEFSPNNSQFSARFVGDTAQPAGAPIPIAAVGQVALDLV